MIFKVQSTMLGVNLNTRYAVSKRNDNRRRNKMDAKDKRIKELEKECEELNAWIEILQDTIDDLHDYIDTIDNDD